MKKLLIFVLFAVAFLAANAQKTPEQLGGVYYAYPSASASDEASVLPPGDYVPFYISHYGRHGSRWLPSDLRYEWVLAQFDDAANLTKKGKSVRKRLQKIWKNARGNGGKLTPLGARQHRDIARRMYHRFPQIFSCPQPLAPSLLPLSSSFAPYITAHSSVVGRCVSSMESFVAELTTLNPELEIAAVAQDSDMQWLAYDSPDVKALQSRVRPPLRVSPDRLVSSLFLDTSKVENPAKLLGELFTIASDMQDVEIPVSLFDIFTEDEMVAVYNQNNERMTICNGNNIQNEGIPARSAISLWERIEADAEAAMARGCTGADLRFGHDTNLYRLLTLLGIAQQKTDAADFDRMDEILPMAANLQMVFYKQPNKPATDSTVLVAFMHNEQPVVLPIPSFGRVADSSGRAEQHFFSWLSVKEHVASRIHRLEHLRQLCSLNTMVGTAQANTKTAGFFGKGSEEHGQTLPAVLAPHGQNFWTPQTRDTEKKCVAPYYYADSLLQGFRNSHWIVGGCTQDYGSFTVAAITGQLRTTPEARATRFSHSDEISHPHYYAVSLPDEHLKIELTGASHTAIMRVTPETDGPVHIIVNHNSDEGEGTMELAGRDVYGCNPVHRIYQGWGERAGFSGHFLLRSAEDPVGSGQDSTCVWLTFQGKAHCPIVLQMASSFTGRDGCLQNLAAEAQGKTFEQMQTELADRWVDRLHTIDIDDPDTARVTQFYGALYRTSFLPRELSDCDGRYPPFASQSLKQDTCLGSLPPLLLDSLRTQFTDFSLWDTYRAQHPLLNIIAPSLSAEMLQSLVNMAEEGGWMPIFPCWNSYTAAMIGDHSTSLFADAYEKGIANVDYSTAYRYLRQNAFTSPDIKQYKDGMGRRALKSYLQYGYIPLEDHVPDAFHTDEQTSRTLEYAYDDFCLAQLARNFGTEADYKELLRRSGNWRNVVNTTTGWADGRHADGSWEQNLDIAHRKSYITEGATCHYTWYVPHDIPALVEAMGGKQQFEARLDSMFDRGLYWHGNEPCHQIAYLYNYTDHPEKTSQRVRHILQTEYNDTPGGLSGNDDAGQMSAWYIFSALGFYPVCPGTPVYLLAAPTFRRATINLENGNHFTIESESTLNTHHTQPSFGGAAGGSTHPQTIAHSDILRGGTLRF